MQKCCDDLLCTTWGYFLNKERIKCINFPLGKILYFDYIFESLGLGLAYYIKIFFGEKLLHLLTLGTYFALDSKKLLNYLRAYTVKTEPKV